MEHEPEPPVLRMTPSTAANRRAKALSDTNASTAAVASSAAAREGALETDAPIAPAWSASARTTAVEAGLPLVAVHRRCCQRRRRRRGTRSRMDRVTRADRDRTRATGERATGQGARATPAHEAMPICPPSAEQPKQRSATQLLVLPLWMPIAVAPAEWCISTGEEAHASTERQLLCAIQWLSHSATHVRPPLLTFMGPSCKAV